MNKEIDNNTNLQIFNYIMDIENYILKKNVHEKDIAEYTSVYNEFSQQKTRPREKNTYETSDNYSKPLKQSFLNFKEGNIDTRTMKSENDYFSQFLPNIKTPFTEENSSIKDDISRNVQNSRF